MTNKYHRFYLEGLPHHEFVIFLLLHFLTFQSKQKLATLLALDESLLQISLTDFKTEVTLHRVETEKKQTANEEMLLPNSSTHHIK